MADDKTGHINSIMKPIFDFLSLENLDIEYNYYYVGKYKNNQEINDNTIIKLKNIYKDENEKLFEFIGKRIESWQ